MTKYEASIDFLFRLQNCHCISAIDALKNETVILIDFSLIPRRFCIVLLDLSVFVLFFQSFFGAAFVVTVFQFDYTLKWAMTAIEIVTRIILFSHRLNRTK